MALGNNLKKQSGSTQSQTSVHDASGEKSPVQADSSASAKSSSDAGKLQQLNKEVSGKKAKSDENLMLIVFSVETEEYALPIDMVREVVKTPPIAPIPQVPDYIKGVANVRGNVFSILDLGLKMGLSNDTEKLPSHLMVMKDEEYSIAIGIERVPNTLMVRKSEIDYSSEVMLHSGSDEAYIKGVVKKDDRMIILVDILEMVTNQGATE